MTRAVVIALLTALAALGFGLTACHDPYQTTQPRQPPAPPGTPHARGDAQRPGPTVPAVSATPAGRDRGARGVVVAFARAWSTWDWRTAADQQHALARLAVGPLAAQLHANAATTAGDASLARDRPGSRGRVITVDLHRTQQGVEAVVVTREQTTTNGHADLGGARHHVYRATLTRSAQGWGVSAWTPLP
jgi:hypothetical protein